MADDAKTTPDAYYSDDLNLADDELDLGFLDDEEAAELTEAEED